MSSTLIPYISGTVDPTIVAIYGEIGWLYIRIGGTGPQVYQKITSNGEDINWVLVGSSSGPSLYADVIVVATADTVLSGTPVIDDYSTSAGERILLVGQTSSLENGIWIIAAGPWTRASDLDSGSEAIVGKEVRVTQGTSWTNSIWAINNSPAVIDVDVFNWVSLALSPSNMTIVPEENNTLNLGGISPDQRWANIYVFTSIDFAGSGLAIVSDTSDLDFAGMFTAGASGFIFTSTPLPSGDLNSDIGSFAAKFNNVFCIRVDADTSPLVLNGTLISANNLSVSDVLDPLLPQDAATKAYVDAKGGWTKYTVAYDDPAIFVAALIADKVLFSLPSNSVIEGIIIRQSVSFGGGAISAYTISVGDDDSGPTSLASPFDIFQAVGDMINQSSANLNLLNSVVASNINIRVTSVGANLDQATGGSADIWVKTSALP